MEKRYKKIKVSKLFWTSVLSISIMSATFLLMPLSNDNQVLTVAIGFMFWLSTIVGYTTFIIANKQIDKNAKKELKGNLGLLSVFQNPFAKIVDIVFIISFIAFVIISFTQYSNDYIAYVFVFMLTLSFNYHCIFNGRLYKFIKK